MFKTRYSIMWSVLIICLIICCNSSKSIRAQVVDEDDSTLDSTINEFNEYETFESANMSLKYYLETFDHRNKSHEEILQNLPFLFVKQKVKCTMYSKSCFIEVLVKDAKVITNLMFSTDNRQLLAFTSFSVCNHSSLTNTKKAEVCSPITSLFDTQNKKLEELLSNYIMARIHVYPELVGRANLLLTVANNTFKYGIIISSPQRFIDIFQQIVIITFSVLISTIMGILLDTTSLLKIIKMPIAVIIGFVSQYCFMPLVIPHF
jgi:hypothetical protein